MTELEGTAYHEAAHAVLMVLYGIRFEGATIVADADALGRVLGSHAPWFHPDTDASPYAQHYLRSHIVGLLAGPIAEEVLTGEPNTVGASDDHDQAKGLAMRTSVEPITLLDQLWKDAEGDVGAFWDHITAVANALLARLTLSEEEVVAIMSEVPENPNPFE